MEEIKYTKELNNRIISFENQTYKKYIDVIDKYRCIFEKKGFQVDTFLWWCSRKNKSSYTRIDFDVTYHCYVCFEVKKNNKCVAVEGDKDEEIDYFPLSYSYCISLIDYYFFRKKLYLFDGNSTEGVYSDLKKDLEEALFQLDTKKYFTMD